MRNKLQRKIQRKVNHIVRDMNKNIEEDNLWRGRFFLRQIKCYWHRFEDNSGGILNVCLKIKDKKTGAADFIIVDNYNIYWELWKNVNDFIIHNCKVWENRDELFNDKVNYKLVVEE